MKKFLLTIIATILMAGSISAQNVARKCVLVEAFTGINCVYCPAAAGGIGGPMACVPMLQAQSRTRHCLS